MTRRDIAIMGHGERGFAGLLAVDAELSRVIASGSPQEAPPLRDLADLLAPIVQ